MSWTIEVKSVAYKQYRKLDKDARREITEVIARHNGKLFSMGNPSTTLEELFLGIIRESEARPGRRVRGTKES